MNVRSESLISTNIFKCKTLCTITAARIEAVLANDEAASVEFAVLHWTAYLCCSHCHTLSVCSNITVWEESADPIKSSIAEVDEDDWEGEGSFVFQLSEFVVCCSFQRPVM